MTDEGTRKTPEDGAPEEIPGELDGGHNMIARDFDRAVAVARLSGLQHFLLQRAREASWTMATLDAVKGKPLPPAEPFWLEIKALADLAGCSREALGRARDEMIAMGLFVEVEGGAALKIGKDYRKWIDAEGRYLLTPKQRDFAREARDLRRVVQRDKKITGVIKKSRRDVIKKSPQRDKKITSTRLKDHVDVTKKSRPPIEDRAREFETENLETGDVVAGSIMPPSKPKRPSRPITPVPADLDRLAAWAEALSPMEGLGSKLRGFSTSYPLSWLEDAILCALSGAQRGKLWAYAHRCLLEWWELGERPHKEIADARAKATTARILPPGVRPSEARIVPIHRAAPDPDRPAPRPRNATPSPNGPPKDPTR